MHEMALAHAIVDLVEEQARRDGFTHVRRVRLCIGALAHVDPAALLFGFEVAARGTTSDGAELAIDRPPGRAACTECGATVSVAARGDPCSACGGYRWLLVEGDDLRVVDLEVD